MVGRYDKKAEIVAHQTPDEEGCRNCGNKIIIKISIFPVFTCANMACWCGADTVQRTDNIKKHPFHDVFDDTQFRYCDACKAFCHPCSGCDSMIVDWWKESFPEVWDDIYVCFSCNGVFCPSCNQHRGHFIDEEGYYCEACSKK